MQTIRISILATSLTLSLTLGGCGVMQGIFQPNKAAEDKAAREQEERDWGIAMQSRAKELRQRLESGSPDQYDALRKEVDALVTSVRVEHEQRPNAAVHGFEKQFERPLQVLEAKHRAASWKALSVVERLGLAPEDAIVLDKVADAYARTTPAQLLTIKEPKLWYQPTPAHEDARPHFHASKDAAEDYRVEWGEGNWRAVIAVRERGRPLAVGSTALLWEINDNKVVLVTPSGGRYVTTNLELVATLGVAQPSSVEDPNFYFGLPDLEKLEAAGQLPQGTHARIDGLLAQADRCAGAVWKQANRKMEAIKVADLHPVTRENRLKSVRIDARDAVESKCNHHLPKIQTAFEAALAQWQAKRAGLSPTGRVAASKR